MGVCSLSLSLRHAGTQKILMSVSVAIIFVTVFQSSELSKGRIRSFSPLDNHLVGLSFSNENYSMPSKFLTFNTTANDNSSNNVEGTEDQYDMKDADTGYNLASKDVESNDFNLKTGLNLGQGIVLKYLGGTNVGDTSAQSKPTEIGRGHLDLVSKFKSMEASIDLTFVGLKHIAGNVPVVLSETSTEKGDNLDTASRRLDADNTNVPSVENITHTIERQPRVTDLMHDVSDFGKNSSATSLSPLKRGERQPISISQMNSILLQNLISPFPTKPRWSSACDRELLSAKLEIEDPHVIKDIPGLHATAYRNISMFKRSYELMDRLLKIYIYKEGEKPIFHQSKMRGIYASEGWLMKLMEGDRKFVVRNPKKAHLFYLPFSTYMLRTELFEQMSRNEKNLEEYLKKYVNLIAGKYSFWNRTGGADHFLVGCHDWASRLTRNHMSNCIRVLCNANVGRGFKIGKDTTLPVTYVRSSGTPLSDIGGKPPSERPILAFFAGSMHGYLRPILLEHWENKEPDMKIFGPMPRDIDGKRMYREYMKSSKYCICARGYEVHTPRVVEAIFNECVPVIISDNYVPPFFEVLNWESFSVFVQEKDIPNLRNILLSIPEKKYLEMHLSVKMVQQHFLWHKKPVKYDLFHMILHSVWHNRVFSMRTK